MQTWWCIRKSKLKFKPLGKQRGCGCWFYVSRDRRKLFKNHSVTQNTTFSTAVIVRENLASVWGRVFNYISCRKEVQLVWTFPFIIPWPICRNPPAGNMINLCKSPSQTRKTQQTNLDLQKHQQRQFLGFNLIFLLWWKLTQACNF